MKVVGIDVEALEKRKLELQHELATVEQVLTIAKNGAGLPEIRITERQPSNHRTVNNSGIRRICLLTLLTGPCSVEDIARSQNQDFQIVRHCLHTARANELVIEQPNRQFVLTIKGRTMAQWHQANPRYITYNGPSLNAQTEAK
jgi:hypothetical protein